MYPIRRLRKPVCTRSRESPITSQVHSALNQRRNRTHSCATLRMRKRPRPRSPQSQIRTRWSARARATLSSATLPFDVAIYSYIGHYIRIIPSIRLTASNINSLQLYTYNILLLRSLFLSFRCFSLFFIYNNNNNIYHTEPAMRVSIQFWPAPRFTHFLVYVCFAEISQGCPWT